MEAGGSPDCDTAGRHKRRQVGTINCGSNKICPDAGIFVTTTVQQANNSDFANSLGSTLFASFSQVIVKGKSRGVLLDEVGVIKGWKVFECATQFVAHFTLCTLLWLHERVHDGVVTCDFTWPLLAFCAV